MKLQCQVEVINRTHNNLNIRIHSKYLKSTLALGKEPKGETEYFILHFSTVNKSGIKYRVKNIKQVFVRCINEGKSTLRFEEPPHDLCIKSESIQLKCFMKLLKSCIAGDTKALKLVPLTTLSITAKDNAPTKLVIRDRSEFPSQGLPRTLESLCISGLKLCNFRRDILLLKQLTVLNLSDNEIEKLPAEFGRMPALVELYLGNNKLGCKEEIDWRWLQGPQITKTLRLLDLGGNKLSSLPNTIWKLQNLVTLKLDNNLLKKLPANIGHIHRLQYLTVSQNDLESLPHSLLLRHKLQHIDISGNKFGTLTSMYLPGHLSWEFRLSKGNLLNLAAKVVLKHKIYYAPNIIPRTLVQFLDDADICVECKVPAINMLPFIKDVHLREYYSGVFIGDGYNAVQIEMLFCSRNCFDRHIIK